MENNEWQRLHMLQNSKHQIVNYCALMFHVTSFKLFFIQQKNTTDDDGGSSCILCSDTKFV
jgi:hypothetical protein